MNGKYYSVVNPVFGQCWEIIAKPMNSPEQATPATINTEATIFSKAEIEKFRQREIDALKIKTGSLNPLGAINIYGNLVFLINKDTVKKIYTFWYRTKEILDGSFWEDGIVEFIFSPCVGIIGGTFSSYFAALHIDSETQKMTGIQYDGFYKAKLINGVPAEQYLRKNCK